MESARVTALPATPCSVMALDDQATSRAILEQVLRALDPQVAVHAFARAVDAVVWATRYTADLVLVDYLMPDMDGIAFAQRLRSLAGYAHVPIVMVTAHEDREVLYAALDAGVTDFLAKPVDARECLARCRNLLTLRRQQRQLEARQRSLEETVAEATRELHEREREMLRWLESVQAFRDAETAQRLVRGARYARRGPQRAPLPTFRPRRRVAGPGRPR